ncbi:hypothetical protein G5B30_02815 [Sphingobacterium sp. SGG-5]|nr:hypothetical protein [Sphingobacterium sp. SGG-5]
MAWCIVSFGQETSPLVVDDIQVDVKDVKVSVKGDSVTVDLFLISYQKHPREFRLNTFASGVVDSKGSPYLYASMQMGQVKIDVSDRQNYLNYLLEPDEPTLFQLKTGAWKKQWGKPKQVKLTFEDSTEEGKFLEVSIDLDR